MDSFTLKLTVFLEMMLLTLHYYKLTYEL